MSAFLQSVTSAEIEQELNTVYYLCPEKEDARLVIDSYELADGTSKSEDGETEKPWVNLIFKYEVDDQAVRDDAGMDKVIVRGKAIFLNLTPQGKLDPARNQALARRFKVLGVETVRSTLLESLNACVGKMVTGKIVHTTLTDKHGAVLTDDEGNDRIVAEVTAIS